MKNEPYDLILRLSFTKLAMRLGLALLLAVQLIHAQQHEYDRELLAAIKVKAEKGDAHAQYELGQAFELGFYGMAKNKAAAIKWYHKSAEQDFTKAQLQLGFCYAAGEGIEKDVVEAVKWFRKAAEQNDPSAQVVLGVCYQKGEGVAKDLRESVNWLQKSAEQNNADAQYYLGFSYANGEGVATNYAEAAKWFRKAAEQEHPGAQFRLGICYFDGEGVKKDDAEGMEWWLKAAHQNYYIAFNALGMRYANGRGVKQDYVEAYKWYMIANKLGLGNELVIKFIEDKMTAEQIAEGKRLAQVFKPRKALPRAGGPGVDTIKAPPKSTGTGFFITENGYLITSQHVAREDAQVRLVTEDGLIGAVVVKVDVANDLALLKADGKFAALPVASSRGTKLGATVITVGFPNIGMQGFAPKLAKGEIAALSGAQDDARHFQISAPIQPGNSGGALVDERGNVVGVVTAKLSQKGALALTGSLPENVNYAVKGSYLLSFLESLPVVSEKMKEVNIKIRKLEDVAKDTEKATVLVLIY